MNTLHLYASKGKDIERAAGLLAAGRLVAFPTETVYGLGARSDDESAVGKLYRVKGRPAGKKAAILVPDIEFAEKYVSGLSSRAVRLAEEFWPGPLTLVVPAGGNAYEGLRCPDCRPVLEMLRLGDVPVTAPSANLSGSPPALSAGEVLDVFEGKINAVLDGGRCGLGRASTVVRVTDHKIEMLREGPVTEEAILKCLNRS